MNFVTKFFQCIEIGLETCQESFGEKNTLDFISIELLHFFHNNLINATFSLFFITLILLFIQKKLDTHFVENCLEIAEINSLTEIEIGIYQDISEKLSMFLYQ